jgi:hypothetical protein
MQYKREGCTVFSGEGLRIKPNVYTPFLSKGRFPIKEKLNCCTALVATADLTDL